MYVVCVSSKTLERRTETLSANLHRQLLRTQHGPGSIDKANQTAFIWGSCVRLSSESCGQRQRGFSTQTQHTIPKLNKTSRFPTPKYCELNEFPAPRRYQTHTIQKYFRPTHPKMSQDVDFKGFGDLLVLGAKKVSWIYRPCVVYHNFHVAHFFLHLKDEKTNTGWVTLGRVTLARSQG